LYIKFGGLPFKYHRISDLKVRELTFHDLENECKDLQEDGKTPPPPPPPPQGG
jgi:hypothetical protein